MSNIAKRNALIIVVSCLITMLIFCSCGLERDYYDDIHIQLESQQGEIIIREWRFLLGSGAEIYHKTDDDEILLGQISGGDDGYCPFKEGLYSVSVDDNEVTIEWCIYPSNKEKPWEKEVFEIPSN